MILHCSNVRACCYVIAYAFEDEELMTCEACGHGLMIKDDE